MPRASRPPLLLPIILALIVALAACGPAPIQPENTPAPDLPSPQVEAAPSQAPSPTPEPSPTADPASLPAPGYTISAVLDASSHLLSAVEEIAYTNRSGEPIGELLLMVDASVFPGVFRLNSLETSQGPAVTGTTWERTWLHVQLERPLAPGEAVRVALRYDLVLPARVASADLRPMVFGWSEQQTNLVDWYPYLPPYQAGQGWVVHPPGYYGEHQTYEASNFEVSLQVTNAPANLIVAASAEERMEDGWRHYTLQNARAFAISLSSNYQVSTRKIGEVTISSYYYPVHVAAGERAAQTAAEALELFGRLFAPYPHQALAVVEADFLDGMEYDGLFFLSNGFYNLYSGQDGDYLVALAAHETAHQWWYGLVGNDQATEPWLDEALCTYSEKLFYEFEYPDALTWWWEVRVRYYQPRGYVDDSIYNPHKEAQAYRAYRDAVYLNGAIFLDELRAQVGDETFFGLLKAYTARYSGKIASTAGFFEVLRGLTTVDLAPLVQKYFANPP